MPTDNEKYEWALMRLHRKSAYFMTLKSPVMSLISRDGVCTHAYCSGRELTCGL
jgi:hypothetical protein